MPFHGPWLTAPLQTTPYPMVNPEFPLAIGVTGTDFAVLSEFAPFDVPPGPLSPQTAEMRNLSGNYLLRQLQWSYSFPLTLLIGTFVDYVPPVLPPGAVSVEQEGFPGGDFLPAITDIHATVTVADATVDVTPIDCGLRLLAQAPSGLHYSVVGSGLPDYHWLPGTQIAAHAALATASLAASSSTVTLNADLPVGDIDTTHGAGDGRRNLLVNLVFGAQVTHAAPADGTGRAVTVSSFGGTVTYQPGRYRFVYDTVTRLRQFPRDDFLGGAPRQGRGNGATSIQSSTRQGWKNTYR